MAEALLEQADAYSTAPPCPAEEAPLVSPAVDPQDSVLPADAAVAPAPTARRAHWVSPFGAAAVTEYWEHSERLAAVLLDRPAQQRKELWESRLRRPALAAWVRIGSGRALAREQASLELPNRARPPPVTRAGWEAPESTVQRAHEQPAAESRAAATVSKAAKKFVLPIKEMTETRAA